MSVPLATATCLLPMVWCILVLFFIKSDTLELYYDNDLNRGSDGTDTQWRIAVSLTTPLLVWWGAGDVCSSNESGTCWFIYSGVVPFVILLVVGHRLSATQTSKRQNAKTLFAIRFNDVYCSARTFQACVQGNEFDILTLVGRTSASTNTNTAAVNANSNINNSNVMSVPLSNETVNTAAFSIWNHCLEARRQTHFRITGNQTENAKYSPAPVYRLLDDCESSRATDVWCGHYRLQNATLSPAEHLALPSLFASNPHVFAEYTGDWARRMKYMDVFLGATIGCMVLASVLPKLSK